jgi:MSHA biogenesis protein MshN
MGVYKMSLLNKMLKDIENRQTSVGVMQPASGNLFQTRALRAKSYSPLISAGLATVVVVAGLVIWSQYHISGSAPPVAQVDALNSLPIPTAPSFKQDIVSINMPLSASSVSSAHQEPAKKSAMPMFEKSAIGVLTPNPTSNKVTEKNTTLSSVPSIPSSFKVVNPQQQSDNFYLQAISLLQQSRAAEAQQALRKSLGANSANHSARQLMANLLADSGNDSEAEALLHEGLKFAPKHSGFNLALAHLQFTQGQKEEAISTMEQGLASAGDDADYHAFFAGLLQNLGRYPEAIQHYITALRSNPAMPNWLIGVGVSLQATDKKNDAAEAFQRAIDTGELSSEVVQFAEQQLKVLRQSNQSSK